MRGRGEKIGDRRKKKKKKQNKRPLYYIYTSDYILGRRRKKV